MNLATDITSSRQELENELLSVLADEDISRVQEVAVALMRKHNGAFPTALHEFIDSRLALAWRRGHKDGRFSDAVEDKVLFPAFCRWEDDGKLPWWPSTEPDDVVNAEHEAAWETVIAQEKAAASLGKRQKKKVTPAVIARVAQLAQKVNPETGKPHSIREIAAIVKLKRDMVHRIVRTQAKA